MQSAQDPRLAEVLKSFESFLEDLFNRQEGHDFSTLIRAEVVTEKKSYIAAGTLFGNQYLRLVQLGPYHLDTFMDGVMLIFTHRDVPGMIGPPGW